MQASLSVRREDCGYSQIRSASRVHSSMSFARLPTFHRRLTTPKRAWSAAIRMSQAMASSIPPARQ